MLETSDFGLLALICSVVHGGCHIARSAYESDLGWVVRDTMNRSGLVSLLLLLVASAPMSVGFVKAKVGTSDLACSPPPTPSFWCGAHTTPPPVMNFYVCFPDSYRYRCLPGFRIVAILCVW